MLARFGENAAKRFNQLQIYLITVWLEDRAIFLVTTQLLFFSHHYRVLNKCHCRDLLTKLWHSYKVGTGTLLGLIYADTHSLIEEQDFTKLVRSFRFELH